MPQSAFAFAVRYAMPRHAMAVTGLARTACQACNDPAEPVSQEPGWQLLT